MTEATPKRRATDPLLSDMQKQIDHLHECIESVKAIGAQNTAALAENTAITKDVRDILATFRILGAIAKWATGMGAFALMLYHVWQRMTGR